jgi:hypothetical protein
MLEMRTSSDRYVGATHWNVDCTYAGPTKMRSALRKGAFLGIPGIRTSSTASLIYGGKLPIDVSGLQSSETELEHIMQKRKKNGEYTGSLLG